MNAFATGFQMGIFNGFCRNFLGFTPMFANPFCGCGCCGMLFPSLFSPMFPIMPIMPAYTPPAQIFSYNSYSSFNYNVNTKMPSVDITFDNTYRPPKMDYFDMSMSDTFVRTIPKKTVTKKVKTKHEAKNRFEKMVTFIYAKEGGYNPDDCGQAGNFGILQSTYDAYQDKHGLPHKDVKRITKKEADKIYYDEYWVASGADKIEDDKLALMVFDTAVNMGVGKAKKLYDDSGGDLNTYKELRMASYKSIAEHKPELAVNLQGWTNRVNSLMSYNIA